jgi:hypothetical protein
LSYVSVPITLSATSLPIGPLERLPSGASRAHHKRVRQGEWFWDRLPVDDPSTFSVGEATN